MIKHINIALRSFRRESKNGYGFAIKWILYRFYYRFIKRHLYPQGQVETDNLNHALIVIIPAVEKDAAVLVHCLRSVREMIRHKIIEIWVVAPESAVIRAIVASENCKFVHEDNILPKSAVELKCRGWVLQQLIKLNASTYVTTGDYLVVDADTVFLKPQSFYRNGKTLLKYADQYELLYNRALEQVFGHSRRFPVSFVTHHMLFNAAKVKELLQLIEKRFGCPWWEAILKEVDQGHLISFSEFELYGHFILSQPNWKSSFFLEYWHGDDRHTEDFARLEDIRKTANESYNTVSFHWHTQ